MVLALFSETELGGTKSDKYDLTTDMLLISVSVTYGIKFSNRKDGSITCAGQRLLAF